MVKFKHAGSFVGMFALFRSPISNREEPGLMTRGGKSIRTPKYNYVEIVSRLIQQTYPAVGDRFLEVFAWRKG